MNSYLPIADYGAIGNLSTIALIGKNGAIDWCCLPHIDSASVFGRLLDHQQGGTFWVRPTQVIEKSRAYAGHTNVLCTYFDTPGGRLTVTDFMPLSGSIEPLSSFSAPPELHRILHAEHGDVTVKVTWAPRFDYARKAPAVYHSRYGGVAETGINRLTLSGLPERAHITSDAYGPVIEQEFTLRAGQKVSLVSRWDRDPAPASLVNSMEKLEETIDVWHHWINLGEKEADRGWASPWDELVARSELTLKLLTFAPTGAIAAAATTSLPEDIGGVRNWDYRFSWLRDAAMAAQALYAMGHSAEGYEFINWAERAAQQKGEADHGLHIMYDVNGRADLPEIELEHLDGYQDSRPVRIGNEAAEQLQLDVYGELLSAAYEIVRLGGSLDRDLWPFLSTIADDAYQKWKLPDYGIWEVRNGPLHFTYSKVRVWMALSNAIQLARRSHIPSNIEQWEKARDEIRQDVLEKGYDDKLGAFRRTYNCSNLDASNLLIPMVEFLPFRDPRVQNNIDATIRHLTTNNLVYRYKTADGLPGDEGAFGLCTFWLVDNLALSGRLDEAYVIFEEMTNYANDLGLFAEQIDPYSGDMLGNFPQAFTHIGLINSVLYLAHEEGRDTPIPAPIGTQEHRVFEHA